MYCMIVVNDRCGILGGVVLLGLCCCQWGRGSSGGVQVFCALRMCGVGERWNKLSYLLVLCLRGLDAVFNSLIK